MEKKVGGGSLFWLPSLQKLTGILVGNLFRIAATSSFRDAKTDKTVRC